MSVKMILRKWQQAAIERINYLQSTGRDRALIAACPGAGKTLFAAHLVKSDETNKGAECIVVVVYSRALKRQWKKALKLVGLTAIDDIDNNTLEERVRRDMDLFDPARPVQIVTYQQVASNPVLFAVQAARHKVFVIFDEVHHADDDATYGKKLVDAFEGAVFKLSLSGTPFNTNGGSLAFCDSTKKIDDEGREVNETICDYIYSYGDALSVDSTEDDPDVVRPLTFVKWEGSVWREYYDACEQDETRRKFTKTYTGKKSDPLSPMLDPSLDYLKKMIAAGLNELAHVRETHSNAGMLIVAKDGDHCDSIAEIVRKLGVNDLEIIVYDTPGAAKKIEEFEKSNQRVLIAVKMISEGVDIKRLQVGVYASNVLTRLFFIQFIGRFIRWDSSLDAGQYARVIVPKHAILEKYMFEIEAMVNSSIVPLTGGGGGGIGIPLATLDKGGDGKLGGSIERGQEITEDEVAEYDRLKKEIGVDIPYLKMRKLKEALGGGKFSQGSDAEPDANDLSKKNDKMVGRIVMLAKQKELPGYEFDSVNMAANRAVGIMRKDRLTSESILAKRLEFLRGLLIKILGGHDERPAA